MIQLKWNHVPCCTTSVLINVVYLRLANLETWSSWFGIVHLIQIVRVELFAKRKLDDKLYHNDYKQEGNNLIWGDREMQTWFNSLRLFRLVLFSIKLRHVRHISSVPYSRHICEKVYRKCIAFSWRINSGLIKYVFYPAPRMGYSWNCAHYDRAPSSEKLKMPQPPTRHVTSHRQKYNLY